MNEGVEQRVVEWFGPGKMWCRRDDNDAGRPHKGPPSSSCTAALSLLVTSELSRRAALIRDLQNGESEG